MTAWPDWVRIEAGGLGRRPDNDVLRTPLDDGLVRQELEYPHAFRTLGITVLLDSDADLARFEAWVAEHGHTWFAWSSPLSGAISQARVRGGAGGTESTSRVVAGRRLWDVRLTLEGPSL